MSAVSSHAPIMEHSPISPEDILFFQQAIALADQTLKLSSVEPLCPATKEKAKDLKESAHEGPFPDSRTNERYTADDYRCNVRNHTRDLLGYFKDEAKFHDLIAELCQIFREHYVLKYMDCHMDDLPVALHKLCGVRNTIKRIAHLFCEDGWTDREYGQERADFLQILKENTPSGRRQRDFNRYTDKLLRGEYNAMAGHLRRDRNLLTTRLHRAEDASLRSILSDAVDKKEKSLFLVNKYIFNGYDDPFWRVYPTKEAVEMSVFQDYWEQRPRRRTDAEDDPFGIPDMGLGPFDW
ncbi:hypothetical protein CGCFRS4_v008564 [Colletotrichum fructicola]|nr:hypothetical protein CGCFRS4_v008564 [Colletotrichum fructicola]